MLIIKSVYLLWMGDFSIGCIPVESYDYVTRVVFSYMDFDLPE